MWPDCWTPAWHRSSSLRNQTQHEDAIQLTNRWFNVGPTSYDFGPTLNQRFLFDPVHRDQKTDQTELTQSGQCQITCCCCPASDDQGSWTKDPVLRLLTNLNIELVFHGKVHCVLCTWQISLYIRLYLLQVISIKVFMCLSEKQFVESFIAVLGLY